MQLSLVACAMALMPATAMPACAADTRTASPAPIPAVRHTSPPRQAAPTTNGYKTFCNYSGIGPNTSQPPGGDTHGIDRAYDAYTAPEWWIAFMFRVPNEWPWNAGGFGNWVNFFNFHAMAQPDDLGCGADGGAGWAFADVSPIRFELGKPSGGRIPILISLEQEDGQEHLQFRPFAVTLGAWHSVLLHVRHGLSAASRWDAIANPNPARPIGFIEVWLDRDVRKAPRSPTWAKNPVGTLRAGVDPKDGKRYCQRWIMHYEGQIYGPSGSENPTTDKGVMHFDYRLAQFGQTLKACLSEPVKLGLVVDHSTYQGYAEKRRAAGLNPGPDAGDHIIAPIPDPGGFGR